MGCVQSSCWHMAVYAAAKSGRTDEINVLFCADFMSEADRVCCRDFVENHLVLRQLEVH